MSLWSQYIWTPELMKLNEHLSKAETTLDTLEGKEISNFDFQWEGIQFHAASIESGSGHSSVTLSGKLGRLHYTVEDRQQRAMAIERLYATNRLIDGRYTISKQGDVSFKSVTKIAKAESGSELMTSITVILLQAERHLRALQSHLKTV